MAATVVLVVIGTVWPIPEAAAYAGGEHFGTPSTAEAALRRLGDELHAQAWQTAYDELANKAKFTEPEFMHDLTGYYPNLRSYSGLDTFEIQPIHASDNDADYRVKLHWATV